MLGKLYLIWIMWVFSVKALVSNNPPPSVEEVQEFIDMIIALDKK